MGKLLDNIKKGLSKVGNAIKSTVQKVSSTISNTVKNIAPTIQEKASAIVGTVASVCTGNVTGIVQNVGALFSPSKNSSNTYSVATSSVGNNIANSSAVVVSPSVKAGNNEYKKITTLIGGWK